MIQAYNPSDAICNEYKAELTEAVKKILSELLEYRDEKETIPVASFVLSVDVRNFNFTGNKFTDAVDSLGDEWNKMSSEKHIDTFSIRRCELSKSTDPQNDNQIVTYNIRVVWGRINQQCTCHKEKKKEDSNKAVTTTYKTN